MFRTAIHIVVTIALCIVLAGSVSAQPLVSIEPDSLVVPHGGTFSLDVTVSGDVTSLMGYNIAVTFDPNLLQLQSVTEGTLPTTSGYRSFFYWLNPASVDSVHVNGAVLGHTVDGPGALFRLTFRAWSPGGAQLTAVHIGYSELRDGLNHDIAHDVRGGKVLIETTIATEQTTWGAVKARYR